MQVQLVRMVVVDHLVHRVPLASMVNKDLLALLDLKVPQDSQERRVPMDRQVHEERGVIRDLLVNQECRVLLDPEESRDPRESEELRATPELGDQLDHRDLRVTLVTGAHLAKLDQRETMEDQADQVHQEMLDSPAPPDWMEPRDPVEKLVLLDHQVMLDHQEARVNVVLPELQA